MGGEACYARHYERLPMWRHGRAMYPSDEQALLPTQQQRYTGTDLKDHRQLVLPQLRNAVSARRQKAEDGSLPSAFCLLLTYFDERVVATAALGVEVGFGV